MPADDGDELPEGFGQLQRLMPVASELPRPDTHEIKKPQEDQTRMSVLLADIYDQIARLKGEMAVTKEIHGFIGAIVKVLAPRALLFVAMMGALGLTVASMVIADGMHILAAILFDVLIFWPTAYLYWKGEHA